MTALPVLHSTNMANVAVENESDLAGLPTLTYQAGTTCFARTSQVLFVWDPLSTAITVPGSSVAVGTGGAWIAIGSIASNLGPFDTVAKITLGQRLIDVSASQLAVLKKGAIVWVESVKDFWRWDPASVLTDDSATEVTICAPTAVGIGPGRFIRMNFSAPEWMIIYSGALAACVIDAGISLATTSNENDGLTAATALRTVNERIRRFGTTPNWNQAEYHIRYISNVPTTQEEIIDLSLGRPGSQVFIHGSMTDRSGQSTLFSGTAGAITALNYTAAGGGQPWEMICATIPASWTASGLIDKRIRFTSGANIGGVMWPIKDLGGVAPAAKARLNEPQVSNTFLSPYTFGSATFAPMAGDTFVVEELTRIPNIVINPVRTGSSTISVGVIADSLDLGTGGRLTIMGSRSFVGWGCTYGTTDNGSVPPNWICGGCQFTVTINLNSNAFSFFNCYTKVALTLSCISGAGITRFMSQGNAVLRLSSVHGGLTGTFVGIATINQYGAWDHTASYPLQIMDRAYLAATATLWGNGNTAGQLTAVLLYTSAKLFYGAADNAIPNSYFYMLTATAGVEAGAFVAMATDTSENAAAVRINVPAFDKATGLFTAPRLLSAANLQAPVAAGGFGGYALDMVTGCGIGQS